jgi:hypothetical protein
LVSVEERQSRQLRIRDRAPRRKEAGSVDWLTAVCGAAGRAARMPSAPVPEGIPPPRGLRKAIGFHAPPIRSEEHVRPIRSEDPATSGAATDADGDVDWQLFVADAQRHAAADRSQLYSRAAQWH